MAYKNAGVGENANNGTLSTSTNDTNYREGIDFNPTVTIPSEAKDGDSYELSVMKCVVTQYNDYKVDNNGTVTATSEEVTTFIKDTNDESIPWSTAYYRVGLYSVPFVQSFGAREEIKNESDDVVNDHMTINEVQNVSFYNENYPEAYLWHIFTLVVIYYLIWINNRF